MELSFWQVFTELHQALIFSSPSDETKPVSPDHKKEKNSPPVNQKFQFQTRSKRFPNVFNVGNNYVPSLVLRNLDQGIIPTQVDRKHLFAAIYDECTKYI